MTDSIGVSVVVPIYNGAATLPALLSGLRSQRPHALGGTEFLLVDNGSTDASRDLVAQSGLPNLSALIETKRGPAAARNRGLNAAKGEVIALLDADCVPTRGWLKSLTEPFSDPGVLLAAGGLASFPPTTPAQRFAARYGLNDATRAIYNVALPFANTRNMAVRRGAALAVGGWSEELQNGEDIEFSYLLRTRFGCEIVYREDALVFHRDRESDADLARQAYGYGTGTATLYRRHPVEVNWSRGIRFHRLRRSMLRRIRARLTGARARVGLGTWEEAEFWGYVALWDRSFWGGFYDVWNAPAKRER